MYTVVDTDALDATCTVAPTTPGTADGVSRSKKALALTVEQMSCICLTFQTLHAGVVADDEWTG
jgi:hypothetical protein